MKLEDLGFSESTYGEVILTVSLGDAVNSAPMGILLHGGCRLRLKVYRTGKTYELIVEGAEDCVLNVTSDPLLFYNAIFKKDELSYCPAELVSSPRIRGCDAYVECFIRGLTHHESYISVLLEPVLVEAPDRTVRVYSRVGPAIIEALISYTRLSSSKEPRERERLMRKIRIFREIVYHSSRNPAFREVADDVLRRSERMLASRNTSPDKKSYYVDV